MNKLITKFKLNRTDNARKWKHQLGGSIKTIKAGDLARMHLQLSKAPDWKNLDYGYRYMGLNGMTHSERMAIMGNTVQENAGRSSGNGIIQWIRDVPRGAHALWDSVTHSIIDPANVYDRRTDSMLNWWGAYKGLNGKQAQKLFRDPNTSLKEKTRIYSDSYIRPGRPEIDKRILFALLLDSIYNPKIKDKVIVLKKKGGKAFVNGVSITDSNPKMYKYVKKNYKMKAQYGGSIPTDIINQSSIISPFITYTDSANDYLKLKQLKEQLDINRELLKLNRLYSFFNNMSEYLSGILGNILLKKVDSSTNSNSDSSMNSNSNNSKLKTTNFTSENIV